MSEEDASKKEVEYVEVPAERTAVSHVFEGIGIFAAVLAGAGVAFTLAMVWLDNSYISSLRERVSDARNEAYSAKTGLDYLSARIRALEAAHDEDHPDKKLAVAPASVTVNGGWYISSGSR